MRLFMASLLFLPLAGCGVELLTTTAIQGELAAKNAQQATKQLNHAKEMKTEIELGQAIRGYQAEHGVFPPSLEALVPDYLYELPSVAYDYNPSTGAFSVSEDQTLAHVQGQNKALPGSSSGSGVPVSDVHTMMKIREAINAYGTATGYYPPSLQSLVPAYLPEVPIASNGEPYLYNNQDGALTHPSLVGQPTPNYAGGGAGGYTTEQGAGKSGSRSGGAASTTIDSRQQRNAAQFGGVSPTGVGNPVGTTPNIGSTKSRVTDSLNRSVSGRQ